MPTKMPMPNIGLYREARARLNRTIVVLKEAEKNEPNFNLSLTEALSGAQRTRDFVEELIEKEEESAGN